MSRFVQGQKIDEIWWEEGDSTKAGVRGCESITVEMENGDMALVAWFLTKYDDGRKPIKYNGRYVHGIIVS